MTKMVFFIACTRLSGGTHPLKKAGRHSETPLYILYYRVISGFTQGSGETFEQIFPETPLLNIIYNGYAERIIPSAGGEISRKISYNFRARRIC